MGKIWKSLALFFLGLAAGIVAGVKLMGDQVTIEIRKIKTKKGEANVDINLDVDNAKVKPKRAERRKKRKNGTKLAEK